MKTLRTLINGALAGTGTAFAGLVLVTGLMALPVETAHAQWFRCASGELQTQGNPTNRARCWARVQPDAGCPVGTTFSQDHQGSNTDRCIPVTGTVAGGPFPSKCGPGQHEQRRSGRDRCYNSTPVSTPAN